MIFYHRATRTETGIRTSGGESHRDAHTGSNEHPGNEEAADSRNRANERTEPTAEQRREWRRWIIEEFVGAAYGVVPVATLVEQIADREPESVASERIRGVLIENILPTLDDEGVLTYDRKQKLVINYGDH